MSETETPIDGSAACFPSFKSFFQAQEGSVWGRGVGSKQILHGFSYIKNNLNCSRTAINYCRLKIDIGFGQLPAFDHCFKITF